MSSHTVTDITVRRRRLSVFPLFSRPRRLARASPVTSARASPGRSAFASPVHAPGAPRREREAAFVARARTGRTGLDRERLAGRFASRESREPRIEERPWGESVGERRARHARARARGSLRGAMRAHRGARVLRGPPAFVEAPRARPAPTRLATSPGRGRRRLLRRRRRRRRRRFERVVDVFPPRVRLGRGRDEPGQLPARGGASTRHVSRPNREPRVSAVARNGARRGGWRDGGRRRVASENRRRERSVRAALCRSGVVEKNQTPCVGGG